MGIFFTAFLVFWNNDVWMRQRLVNCRAAGKLVSSFFQGTVWESSSGQGRCTGCKNKQPFIGMRVCTLHCCCTVCLCDRVGKSPQLLLLWTLFYFEPISKTLLKMSSLVSISLQSENMQRESKGCVLMWFAFHFVQIFIPFEFCFILILIFIWFSHCQFLQFSERCLLFCLQWHIRNQNIPLHLPGFGVLLGCHVKMTAESNHEKHTEKMCKSCVLSGSVASQHLANKLSWHLYISENSH